MDAKVEMLVGSVDPEVFVEALTVAVRKILDELLSKPAYPGQPERYIAEQVSDFLIHMAARAREAEARRGGD